MPEVCSEQEVNGYLDVMAETVSLMWVHFYSQSKQLVFPNNYEIKWVDVLGMWVKIDSNLCNMENALNSVKFCAVST